MRRLSAVLLVAAGLIGVLNGCALKLDYRPQLQAIIRHTEALARTYTYTMTHAGHRHEVAVVIGDDFRYLATYTQDGRPEAQEIVADDARALRVTDATLLSAIKTPAAPAAPVASGGAAAPVLPVTPQLPVGGFVSGSQAVSPSALAALQKGDWVEDSSGAYQLLRPVTRARPPAPGTDQIGDALQVLDQLSTYLGTLGPTAVVPFNPEAGYYFKALDPFPRPPAGTQRFDISLSPQLPARSALNDSPSQREQAIPLADYFLSAALYVRNGVVVSVRESVDVALRLRLPDQDILARLRDAQIKLPGNIDHLTPAQQAQVLDRVLNQFYARRQDPALVQRYVVVDFTHLGAQGVVSLPANPTPGSLAGIFDRGQILGGGA